MGNNMDADNRRRRGLFEQRVQTVLMTVVTALILWVGNSLLDVRDRLTRLEISSRAEILALSLEVERLKALTNPHERNLRNHMP